MKIFLIFTITILILISIVLILIKIAKNEKNKRIEIEEELKKQKENLLFLFNHSEEIATIKADKNRISQNINSEKTDEEVINIINTVINSNNNRV